MKKSDNTAMDQTFGDIRIVAYTEGTIRRTHILHMTPAFKANVAKKPLESGLSGRKLVEELRKEDRDALYHDLTKDEARALKQQGAPIDIPDDEFNVVPSTRGVSIVTGIETSRGHWRKKEDGNSCTLFDPDKYDPRRPERITAAVQYRDEQTGELIQRCYFPQGKLSDPAPGIAADSKLKDGFEYEQNHYMDGAPANYIPEDLKQKYTKWLDMSPGEIKAAQRAEEDANIDVYEEKAVAEEEPAEKSEGTESSKKEEDPNKYKRAFFEAGKMLMREMDRVKAAHTLYDQETRLPIEKLFILRGSPHDLAGKDMAAKQTFNRLTGELTEAWSSNFHRNPVKLSEKRISAFNERSRNGDTISLPRTVIKAGPKTEVKIETPSVGLYL
jgi:hypothetical protein